MAKKPTKVEDLKLDDENARTRNDKAKKVLSHSLETFGAARSLVADKDGKIIAGNGTVEAAKEAGIQKVKWIKGKPDELVVVQREDLDGESAKAYAIADNRTGELAEWDMSTLVDTIDGFGELTAADVGFTDKDLGSFPDFSPAPDSEQSRLDVPPSRKCPECGHEF